jgi:hypothetical protein
LIISLRLESNNPAEAFWLRLKIQPNRIAKINLKQKISSLKLLQCALKCEVRHEGKALTFYWKIIQYYRSTHEISNSSVDEEALDENKMYKWSLGN